MPLTDENILLVTARYEEMVTSYEAVARNLHAVLAALVQRLQIRHMVTHRAKSPDSLAGKLRKSRATYGIVEGKLRPKVKDLVAARVLLYVAEDAPPVVAAIREHFQTHGHSVVDCDKRSALSHYDAHHFHVDCRGDGLDRGNLPVGTLFEVQVSTITAHLWNELEHDIIYKQPSAQPDEAQRELLFALHGELGLSARTVSRLIGYTTALMEQNSRPLLGAEDLSFLLRMRAHRALRGDFRALFAFLAGLMDPLDGTALHLCFQKGLTEEEAMAVAEEHDLDKSHHDVGVIAVQLLPNFRQAVVASFLASHADPPTLFRFIRRITPVVHKMRSGA